MDIEKQIDNLIKKVKKNTKIKSYEILEKKGLNFSEYMKEEYLQLLTSSIGIETPIDGEEWESGVFYKKGSIVEEKGKFFKCIASHISNLEEENLYNAILWQKRG